jgi:hypothetical protein
MAHDCDASPAPDDCFKCKMRYIRAKGGLGVSYQGGKAFFHGATIKERQDKIVAECRANGWEPRLKNPLYDR